MSLKALVLPYGSASQTDLVTTALETIGCHVQTLPRGPKDWHRVAIDYIRDERPQLLVTWQRLYRPGGRYLRDLAWRYGVQTLFMDFGVWPHYQSVLFDSEGENGESCLVGRFDEIHADVREIDLMAQALPRVDAIASELKLSIIDFDSEPEGLLSPYALLTLQRKDKVLELDAAEQYRDQQMTARIVTVAFAKAGGFLAVKPHPTGRPIQMAQKSHSHVITQAADLQDNQRLLAWLLVNCTHLVTVNSTTWMLAAALGKPVCALGRGWYSDNDIVHECSSPEEAVAVPTIGPDRAKRFVALLLSRQLTIREMYKPERILTMIERILPGWQDAMPNPGPMTMTMPRAKEQIYGYDAPSKGHEIAPTIDNLVSQGATGLVYVAEPGTKDVEDWSLACKDAGLRFILGFRNNLGSKFDEAKLAAAARITDWVCMGNGFGGEWMYGPDAVNIYRDLAHKHGLNWVCGLTHRAICRDLRDGCAVRNRLFQTGTLAICFCGYILAGYLYGDPEVPHQGWQPNGKPFTTLTGHDLCKEYGLTIPALQDYLAGINIITGAGFQEGLRVGVRVYARQLGFKGLMIGVPFDLRGSNDVDVFKPLEMYPPACGDFSRGYQERWQDAVDIAMGG